MKADPLMICEELCERSFESVSKDKFTRRRRAAFDTDEKDVTKKDVKTPLLRTIFNSLRSNHDHEIYSVWNRICLKQIT